MSEATLILPNMRGGCATVGSTVHTLFRVSNRSHRLMAQPTGAPSQSGNPHADDREYCTAAATPG